MLGQRRIVRVGRDGDRKNSRLEWQQRHDHVCKLNDEIRCAKVPKMVYDAVKTNDIRPLMRAINYDGTINESNYFQPLKLLMLAEEAHQAIEMRKHDKLGYEILYEKDPEKQEFYAIKFFNPTENLDISDQILLEDASDNEALLLRIKKFEGDLILLKEKDFQESYLRKELNVYFISSGISYAASQEALSGIREDPRKRRFIFEREGLLPGALDDDSDNSDSELGNARANEPAPLIELNSYQCDLVRDPADVRLDQLNHEQRQAVIGIFEAKCRPKPYILFGPPGTGKTHTLVEAVAQIYLRSSRLRVLFCANSNTCVDQIYEKLKETGVFSDSDLFRLKAGDFMDATSKCRVVVTTNIKSANLASGPAFDYVFLDEAGHAHEAESLIPIRCVRDSGSLVLAGDPKQLAPVVQFQPAGYQGLGSSMLERVIEWDIYKRKGQDRKYDSKCITKLLTCYRCDPRILTISNRLFYDNELHCKFNTPAALLRIMRLSNPVQVLFCNEGEEFQTKASSSWKNSEEIEKCVDLVIRLYKMGLSPDQIGVMSPYKKQAEDIRKKLRETLGAKMPSDLARMLNKRFAINERKTRKVHKNREAEEAELRNLTRKLRRVKLGLLEADDDDKDEPVEMIEQVYYELKQQDWMCKISTVDSFQGNEREVIIFSSVRTDPRKLGFLGDPRRFNVAMSRAKMLLITVGHEKVLQSNKYWNEFLCEAKEGVKDWPRQSMLDPAFSLERPLFH